MKLNNRNDNDKVKLSGFLVIPAVDIKDGKCVRLTQGKADQCVVYSDDPLVMAAKWADEGAEYLHVVDLDGAFEGKPVNLDKVAAIVEETGVPVELGGGLRTESDIERCLEIGVSRAIIGTRAVENPESIAKLAKKFGDSLAVGIDAKNGIVQTKGWVEGSEMKATDLAKMMVDSGVRTIIFTDTNRDGMMRGTNVDAVAGICRVASCNVIASGGVTSVSDIVALRRAGCPNLIGAIVGKAIYEGKVSLRDLVSASRM